MNNDFKDRLKAVRKSLPKKTSQEAFAKSLGLTRTAYNKYEIGIVVPTDTFIKLLCTTYSISEEWLKTGKGEMFQSTEKSLFNSFAKQYDLSDKEQQAARYLLSLSSEERQNILHHLECLVVSMQNNEKKKSEELKRQEAHRLLDMELDAEQKGQSALGSGNSNAKMA